MTRSTIVTIAFLLVSTCVSAQVKLKGEVHHGDELLSGVTIKVIEDGKVVKTLMVNRRGKYETEFAFNKQYVLSYHRAFMYPVSIAIDTRIPMGNTEDLVYEVPLNMEMFYRYPGIPDGPFSKPIGIVKRTGMGEESFSFVASPEVIQVLKALHNQSLEKEASGEEPVEQAVDDKEIAAFEYPKHDNSSGETTKKPGTADKTTKNHKHSDTETSNTPIDEKGPESIDPNQKRFTVLETSKAMEQDRARANESDKVNSKEKLGEAQVEFISTQKAIAHDQKTQEEIRSTELADARVAKNEQLVLLADGLGSNTRARNTAPNCKVIKYSVDEGMFLTEERLLVLEGAKNHEYKMTSYNWLLFETTYFTRDEEEITEHEYKRIRQLVDI